MSFNKFFLMGLFLIQTSLSADAMAQNKLESWYTYWGIGYADVSYPKELDETFKQLNKLPGVSHLSLSLDLLGFFGHSGDQTIAGGIINGWGDRYTVDMVNMQVNGILYAFSLMHFVNNKIGQGIFIRGDFGPTRLVINRSEGATITSDWGYGGLLGGGFGLPISPGTRLLLHINYSFRHIEGDSYNSLQISIGGLF